MAEQEAWEAALEDKLAESSPQEVLKVIRRIHGWLIWYCPACGTFNDICGGKRGCKCYREIVVG